MTAPKSISYGGGVQSTAMIILAIAGQIDADVALFANVGKDSERSATLRYVRQYIVPYCASHRFPLYEIQRIKRNGEVETLWERMMKPGSRSLPIPVRGSDTGAPGRRSCTGDFKIKVVAKWLKANGASATDPATVYIGISTDEIQRAQSKKKREPHEIVRYPLIELGLDRSACTRIITDAGLPVPPKSACFFCPFHTRQVWSEMARDEPDEFAKSVHLERVLNERRVTLGKDPVYLTRYGRPLDEVVTAAQSQLPGFETTDHTIGEDGCDEGVCFV